MRFLGVQQPDSGVGEPGQIGGGVGDRIDRGDDDESVGTRGQRIEGDLDGGSVRRDRDERANRTVRRPGVVVEHEVVIVQHPAAVTDQRAHVQGDIARPVHAQHVVVVGAGLSVRRGSLSRHLTLTAAQPATQSVAVQQVDQFGARHQLQGLPLAKV